MTTISHPRTLRDTDPGDPWTSVRYTDAAAEELPAHMRPAGAVRMAMLLHLAQMPQGIGQAALGMVAIGACKRSQTPPSTEDMRVICGHMAAQGLLAAEVRPGGEVTYYSPMARKAHRLRSMQGYTLRARIQPAEVTE